MSPNINPSEVKMRELPEEMIAEILSCSPANSLLRFRCVSKSWCFLIDSSLFINTHLNRSHNTSNRSLVILDKSNPHLYSLDFNFLHTLVPLETHFRIHSILGSSNGLLLLMVRLHAHYPPRQLALFNPSTKEYRILPQSLATICAGGYIQNQNCGLAYDIFHRDYKIIMVVDTPGFRNFPNQILWVYSLKYNFWKMFWDDFPYYLDDPSYALKADLDGILHMVCNKSSIDKTKLIVAVDVAQENFNIVPMPKFFDKERHAEKVGTIVVDVLGGCLSLVVVYEGCTDVWLMDVYGVKESWTKLFSLLANKIHDHVYVELLGYSKTRNEVLLNYNLGKLGWFNLETREIMDLDVCGWPKTFRYDVCVSSLSLVPLTGYGEIGEPRRLLIEE